MNPNNPQSNNPDPTPTPASDQGIDQGITSFAPPTPPQSEPGFNPPTQPAPTPDSTMTDWSNPAPAAPIPQDLTQPSTQTPMDQMTPSTTLPTPAMAPAPQPAPAQPNPWDVPVPQSNLESVSTPDLTQPAPTPNLAQTNPAPVQPEPTPASADPAFNWSPAPQPAAQDSTPALEPTPQAWQPPTTEPQTPATEPQTTPFSTGILGNTVPETSDPAPTDLSQLSNLSSPAYTPPPTENLSIPPSAPIPETSAEERHGLPKALIFGGIGILLLVLIASAYFILGIGKPSTPATTSLPANTQPTLTNPPVQPSPSPATESGNQTGFGAVSPNSTSSASPTSAINILRQQQAGH